MRVKLVSVYNSSHGYIIIVFPLSSIRSLLFVTCARVVGMKECESCTWGEYAPKKAQSRCKNCYSDFGVPYSSYPSASNCTRCVVGFYWDGKQCLKCMQGVVCETAGQTLENLVLKDGYFRFESSSKAIYLCPHDNCMGGNTSVDHSKIEGLQAVGAYKMYMKRSRAISDADDLCRDGARGPLCAICKDEYTLSRQTNRCEKCADAVNPADYVFASAMLLWAFGSFVRAASGAAKYRKSGSSITAVLQMTHLTLDQAIVMGVTIQTLLLFVENYRLAGGEPLPFSYTEFLRFFGFFTLDLEYIFPVGCIDGFKYWIELVTLSVLLIATGIITSMGYLRAKQREGPKAAAHLERFVLFLKFVLPGVVRTSGKAFTCRTFENDAYKSYLIVNYEMDCQSVDYLYFVRPYAAACIIFYGFLVPASMCFFLTRLRVHISNAFKAGLLSFKKATTSEKVEGGSEELTGKEMVEALHKGINANPILRGTALKCLFRFTKPECWWIEIADMYRRLCLTSASLLFEGNQKLLFFGILVTSFCLVVHREVHPFLEPSLNIIKYFEHWLTLLSLIVLLGKDADMFGTYPRIPYALGASVLFATHLAMGGFMVRSIVNRAIQERLDHTAMVQQEINKAQEISEGGSRIGQTRVIDAEIYNARVRDRERTTSKSPKRVKGSKKTAQKGSFDDTIGARKQSGKSKDREKRTRRGRSPRNRQMREPDIDDADDSYFQGTNPLHDDSDWRDISGSG